jgi:metal-responsive CopG/Arc/MetJ family transcriptional regulator
VGSKAKVSVTVDRVLLREIDRLAGRASRSRVFEDALAAWVRRKGQVELDRAIERYYRAQTKAERADDEAWASVGDETIRKSWER